MPCSSHLRINQASGFAGRDPLRGSPGSPSSGPIPCARTISPAAVPQARWRSSPAVSSLTAIGLDLPPTRTQPAHTKKGHAGQDFTRITWAINVLLADIRLWRH